jgi:hypothetical protein
MTATTGQTQTGPCGLAAQSRSRKSEDGHEVSSPPKPGRMGGKGRLSMARAPHTGQTRRSMPVSARKRSRQDGGLWAGGLCGTLPSPGSSRQRRARRVVPKACRDRGHRQKACCARRTDGAADLRGGPVSPRIRLALWRGRPTTQPGLPGWRRAVGAERARPVAC